jgi:hypothetical protein
LEVRSRIATVSLAGGEGDRGRCLVRCRWLGLAVLLFSGGERGGPEVRIQAQELAEVEHHGGEE